MLFSKSHIQAILSAFPVTLATARIFEKSNNLPHLCNLEIQHSHKTLKQNGNRKTFKDHENKVTTYGYDGINRLKKLTHAGLGTFDWSYNNAGLTDKIDYPNGASVEYGYDTANRIASIENKKSGADISKHVYTYDPNGNRLTMRETNIHTDQLIDYTYDKADRLTSVEYPNNEKTTYEMDKVGNRTSQIITGINPNTKTYGYNTRDQLISISDTLGFNTAYTFDDAGNQLTKDINGAITAFDYTARQRVKSITVGAGNPINYQYDFTGQRINHQTNGMEKRFVYDGLTLIAETNTIGNTLARYHYGDRYQLAETRNTTNSYFHVDSMGTNVAVTNQDGSIQARYEYDAYGNLLTQAGSSEQPFGFTGYQKDNDTGLYYANARYYDSETARFNREDPLFGNKDNPPSLHRYNYGYSNPTRFIDPDGQYAEDGHYYTTLIVAQALGFTAEEANTLALYSQLPDEVDSLDAIQIVKNKYFSLGLLYKSSNEKLSGLHSLNGGDSEVETNRTVRAILASGGNLRNIGVLIHRLGDTFAHREFGNEKRLYDNDYGHLADGHDPDVIQQRPELYDQYLQTLISTLAQVKGGYSDDELKRITQNIMARTNKFKNISRSYKSQKKYSGIIELERSNDQISKESIATARGVVRKINIVRNNEDNKVLNESYQPEKYGPGLVIGFDIWLVEAFGTYFKDSFGITNTMELGRLASSETSKAMVALKESAEVLNTTLGIELDDAVKANAALLVTESDENEIELRK